MKLLSYAKIAACCTLFGPIGGYMIYLGFDDVFPFSRNEDENVFVYAVNKKTVTQNAEDEIVLTGNKKNFICEVDNSHYECDLSYPKSFDETTKQSNIDRLTTNNSTSTITKSHLNTEWHIYKIKIHGFAWLSLQSANNTISIMSQKNPKTKYADLSVLFALHNKNRVVKNLKVKHFVVKTTNSQKETKFYNKITGHQCAAITKTTPNAPIPCSIYNFSKKPAKQTTPPTDKTKHYLNSEIFSYDKNSSTDINPNSYYLVELTSDIPVSNLQDIRIHKHTEDQIKDKYPGYEDTLGYKYKINISNEFIPAVVHISKNPPQTEGIFTLYKEPSA